MADMADFEAIRFESQRADCIGQAISTASLNSPDSANASRHLPALASRDRDGLKAKIRFRLIDVIEAVHAVHDPQQFIAWTANELQTVLPHGAMAVGIGEVRGRQVEIQKMLQRDFPPSYLENLRCADGTVSSPIMRRWLQTRKPQLSRSASPSIRPTPNFEKSGLRNAAAHARYRQAPWQAISAFSASGAKHAKDKFERA